MKILVGCKITGDETLEYHILKQLGDGLCEACRYVVTPDLYNRQVIHNGKKQIVQLIDIREKEI